jgi:small subunit ribosomal protein S1
MATLLEGQDDGAGGAQEAKAGDRVSGVVVRIGEEEAFVDFGGRSEGVIRVDELKGEDGGIAFQPGDPIEAFIVGDSGEVVLSRYPSGEARQSDMLYKAFKSGRPVEGTVMAVNKWGLGVSVEGLRAFCPVSQIDTDFTENLESFRHRSMAFKIIRFRDRGRSIVLSRRALVVAEQAKDAGAVRERVTEGAELSGSVTRLENFGAFVDLGARVEGLIHVSELRHERVVHPQDVLQPGQEVKVKVIAVKDLGNRRKERISLSLKALEKSPWTEARARFRAGSVVTGKVESLEDFGAFVELAPNVRGMIHVSEMSSRRVNHPRDVLSSGQEVKVAILEIDDRRQRFRLSMKRAEQMEGEANLRDFAERQEQTKEESPGNATMLEALKRAQLID